MIAQGTATTTAGRRDHDAADLSSPPWDNNASSRKRLRVARACSTCRRRKERCDGLQPSCQRCTAMDRPCSYNPYRKRGLRTGYVRGTEILLGLLLSAYDDADSLILSVLQHGAGADGQTTAAVSPSAAVLAPSASLLETWRSSAALQELQKALAVSESEEDEETYLLSLDARITEAFNALPRRTRPSDHDDIDIDAPAFVTPPPCPPPSALPVAHSSSPLPPPQRPPPPPMLLPSPQPSATYTATRLDNPKTSDSTSPWGPPIPPNWPQLVQIYLSSTHSWLPTIQTYTLFRSAILMTGDTAAAAMAGSGGSSDGLRPGDVASLWAVLSLSTDQLEAARQTGGVLSPAYDRGGPSEPTLGHIYAVAKDMAIRDPECFDAGHVHAFLIMTLVEMGRSAWDKAWVWIGRAVYTAAVLGIVPGITGAPLTQQGRLQQPPLDDTQRRLFLGCFVLDTLLAMKLGHRPYLTSLDRQHVGSITFDGIEEWVSWAPVFATPADMPGHAPSLRPGRILSTFSHIGSLVSLLGRLHLAGAGSVKPQQLAGMAEEFTTLLQSTRPATATGVPSATPSATPAGADRDTAALHAEPPHIQQYKVMVAVTYVRIMSEFVSGPSTALPPSCLRAVEQAMPPDLVGTLSMLASTPRQAPLFRRGGSPSTLPAILGVLDQIGASSPDCYLRPDFLESLHQHHQQHAHQQAHQQTMAASTVLPAATAMQLHDVGRPTTFPVPAVSMPPPTPEPRPGPPSLIAPSLDQASQEDAAANINTSPDPRTPAMPPPAHPPPAVDALRRPGEPLPASTSLAAAPFAASVDDDALFSQLALLDTTDWYVTSRCLLRSVLEPMHYLHY
ncbi:hypothetical protein Sste5346_010254 [Sporothrix stenoceras]|uniref:Zn(2)-C6 fungal-type domain-containing protein n=1 Tax=Sporothrix stenoceras TaxID=5173 RepID=A0ABR3YIX3_9PEZI